MDGRQRRIAALAPLFAAPTAVLLVAGIVLGFPLEGLVLGAGIGCASGDSGGVADSGA